MDILARTENWLWFISSVATVLLLIKFWREGLHRRYKAFFAYLLVQVASAGSLSLMSRDYRPYAFTFFGFEFVRLGLYVLVTLELYRHVLEQHPGIAKLGRRFVLGALLIAVGTGVVLRVVGVNVEPSQQQQMLQNLNMFRWALMSTSLVLLLLVMGFIVWFPVRLNRNTLYYCVGYGAFFATKTFTLLTRNLLGPDTNALLSCITMTVWTGSIFFWLFTLNRRGEELNVVARPQENPVQAERLVQQLEAMNTALLRVARK